MILFRILFICTLFIYGSFPAHAGRPSNCGEISRTDIKDLYEEAEDVRYVFDTRDDIEQICDALEKSEEWLKRHKDTLSSDNKDNFQTILDRGYDQLFDMEDPLKILNVWQGIAPETPEQKGQRIDSMSKAKTKLRQLRDSLENTAEELHEFMVTHKE